MSSQLETSTYVSVTQAAEILGVTRQAIGQAIRRGTLHALWFESPMGFYLIERDELERYRRERRSAMIPTKRREAGG